MFGDVTREQLIKRLMQHFVPEFRRFMIEIGLIRQVCRHTKPNGKMHSRADSILTMTGKTPNKNSKLAKALEIFEKLEKRMGIGQVNAAAFRIELTKKKVSKGLAQRCVTEKVLAYL